MLRIALLGSFQVTLDEQPVPGFESDKVRALLAYLVVEADRPHRREALAALLWPDMPEPTARSNLRHSLTNLRKAIHDYEADPPTLLITRQTIQFNRNSQHALDVSDFLFACKADQPQKRLEEASTLYRGEFLSGFSVNDSAPFEEWLVIKREQYHQKIIHTLGRLAKVHEQCGQYEQAVAYTRRQVELEPWDEIAHQNLMRLLALNDQRGVALAQYETCCRILEVELGIRPTAVTTNLYESIRDEIWPDDTAKLPLPQFVVEDRADLPPPLFVARQQELCQLTKFLNQACAGKSRVAFITGEAGSGKTSLMHAFAQQAMEEHPNLLVVGGKCSAYTGSGDPYLPFLETISMLTGDVESRWEAGDISTDHARRLWAALPEVMNLLVGNGRLLLDRFVLGTTLLTRAQVRTRHGTPEQFPWMAQLAVWVQTEATAVPVPQTDLFVQFTDLLGALSRKRPLLLLLDDLQWIDSGSINLLFHLGQQLHGNRILILGAYRPGDLVSDRAGRPHPFVGLVNEFQLNFAPNQIDLNQAGGRPFIDALIDSQPNRISENFRQILHRQTEGQALFTSELLRGLKERGDLVKDDAGFWIESETLDWDILPAMVEAVIAGRISHLPASCRSVLTIASVEGETFTAEVVADIQQRDEQETIRCLSGDLSRQHRLVMAESSQRLGGQRISRYRFQHFLFQKYLYNDLDPVERANLHEAVGNVLERLYGEQKTAVATRYGQLAWHYREAHVPEKAIAYYQKAGERAWQLSANEEALTYLQQGLELIELMPDSQERKQQELSLLMNMAMPLQAVKGFAAPEFRENCDRAYLLIQQIGQTPKLFSILAALGSYYLTAAQYHTSRNLAQQSFELGQRFQDDMQVVLARLGLTANYTLLGEFVQAREQVEKLIAFYDYRKHHTQAPHHSIDPGVNGHIWATWLMWVLGYPDQAREHSREAIELARILEHPFTLNAALEVSGSIFYIFCREYATAAKMIEESLRIATEQQFGLFLPEGMFYQGLLQVSSGQIAEGIAQMKQSLTAWKATGMRICYCQMLGLLAQALGQAGQIDEGFQVLDEAFTIMKTKDEEFFAAELYRIKGYLLQKREGEAAVIESTYQQAITIARRQHAKSWELRSAISLAKLWQTQGKVAEAHSLLSDIFGWFTEGYDTPDLQEAKSLLENLRVEQISNAS